MARHAASEILRPWLACLCAAALAAPLAAQQPPLPLAPYGPACPPPGTLRTPAAAEPLPIDLPTALRLVNVTNPTIALANERVRTAYARLREAEMSWLPDLQAGPTYNRHDGRIQNSRGEVFSVSKQNLFVGGGLSATLDTSNVYFGPLIARRLVEAQAAGSQAVTYDVQLETALAYLDLLRAYGSLAVNADTLQRAEIMLQSAEAAEKSGLGKTPADANRARTELRLRRAERLDLQGQAAVFSARLTRLLLLQPTVDLRPTEPAIVPVTLVSPATPLDELVAAALLNRPELRESRSLVEAALARWRQARVSPFLPRVQTSYAAGTFGGGVNDDMGNFGSRGDGTAALLWELHNLGAGDVARARTRRSEYNQATLHVTEVQARVAEDVTAAARTAHFRLATLEDSQQAVREALETWRRLRESSFGLGGPNRQFDPLEPLIALRDLDQARTRYLAEVVEYNKAQFRLYWALGRPPACSLPTATTEPIAVPASPPPGPLPEPGTKPVPGSPGGGSR